MNLPTAAWILTNVAVIFVGITLHDFLKREGKLTPARKTWLRVAFFFSGISIAVYLFQHFQR